MANFQTHLSYAAAASGLLSVLCLQIGLVDQRDAFNLAMLGTIGGILPDVDLQRSYPSHILFSLLGMFLAFLMVFSLEKELSILELWLVGLGTYLTIRYPIWYIFHQHATHRGSTHSLLSATLAAFTTAAMSYHLLQKDSLTAWLLALLMFLGFILHLLLDEFYSVDFMNYRLKRSFGSALKICDTRKPYKTLLLIALTGIAWLATPDSKDFFDILLSHQTWQIILSRFFPSVN